MIIPIYFSIEKFIIVTIFLKSETILSGNLKKKQKILLNIIFNNAVATGKVAINAKAEGDLIICGTKGYVYVPAPWWKTDYFEIRFENQNENKKYFYQLDGEGIRYELVAFIKSIEFNKTGSYIDINISKEISSVMEDFDNYEYNNLE